MTIIVSRIAEVLVVGNGQSAIQDKLLKLQELLRADREHNRHQERQVLELQDQLQYYKDELSKQRRLQAGQDRKIRSLIQRQKEDSHEQYAKSTVEQIADTQRPHAEKEPAQEANVVEQTVDSYWPHVQKEREQETNVMEQTANIHRPREQKERAQEASVLEQTVDIRRPHVQKEDANRVEQTADTGQFCVQKQHAQKANSVEQTVDIGQPCVQEQHAQNANPVEQAVDIHSPRGRKQEQETLLPEGASLEKLLPGLNMKQPSLEQLESLAALAMAENFCVACMKTFPCPDRLNQHLEQCPGRT